MVLKLSKYCFLIIISTSTNSFTVHYIIFLFWLDFKSNTPANIMKGTAERIPTGAGPSNLMEPVFGRQTAKGIVPAPLSAP